MERAYTGRTTARSRTTIPPNLPWARVTARSSARTIRRQMQPEAVESFSTCTKRRRPRNGRRRRPVYSSDSAIRIAGMNGAAGGGVSGRQVASPQNLGPEAGM